MSQVTINLRQVCSGRNVVAHLDDVTPEELDISSASTVFGYFTVSARSDESLPAAECNGLSYSVTVEGNDTGRDEIDTATVISERFRTLSLLVEKAIENDPDIREQDDNIITRVLPDGANVTNINMQPVRQHLSAILRNVFSTEEVQNSTPMRLLINYAMVIRYCYNFCKKLCERLRNLVESILPEWIFDILCGVVSVLMRHLSSIGWRTVLTSTIGGWAGAVSSLAIMPVSLPRLPVSPANVCLAVSIVSAAAYLYFSYYS